MNFGAELLYRLRKANMLSDFLGVEVLGVHGGKRGQHFLAGESASIYLIKAVVTELIMPFQISHHPAS